MRGLNYLRSRFEYAVQNTRSIKVNRHDIEALNSLIADINSQQCNEQLEDSLLLFWVLSYWTVDIDNGRAALKENPQGFLKITNLKTVFDRLCTRLMPKEEVIKEIADTLQIAQNEQGLPEEMHVKADEVRNLLETMVKEVKNNFAPISQLKRCEQLIHKYPEGLTPEQREMLGLKLQNEPK